MSVVPHLGLLESLVAIVRLLQRLENVQGIGT